MSDLAAIALILTNSGVQALLLAFVFLILLVLVGAMVVLSSDKLSINAARIGRGWRRRK